MFRRLGTKKLFTSAIGSTGLLSSAAAVTLPVVPVWCQGHHSNISSMLVPSAVANPSIWTPPASSSFRFFGTSKMTKARGAGRPAGSSGGAAESASSSLQQTFSPIFGGGQSSGGGGSTADSLTPQVRAHLFRVYNLLGAAIGACAVGSAAMFLTPLGKIIPWYLPVLGGLVPLFWLMLRPPATVQGQLALFFTFAVFEGMGLAPVIYVTMAKGVLGTALVLTGAVFLGFSASALLAPRASLLKFQGPLFGMLLGMMAISLLNMFWPSAFAHSIILYGGLAIFSALVAVDTQAMIERARCGYGNPVQDALQMFLNVINIFVRIAAILRGD